MPTSATTRGAPRRGPKERQPAELYRGRLKKLRAALRRAGAEAMLVNNPIDVRYLTPFSGEDSALLVLPRRAVLISDFRFEEDLEAAKAVAVIVLRQGAMEDAIAGVIGDLRLARVALQAEHVTVALRDELARKLGARRFVALKNTLADLRGVKDEAEIRAISSAAKLQQRALLSVLPTIEPGQTEQEIAALLEFELRQRGADGVSFPTIVAAGANGSKPHAVPGSARVRAGRPVLIDWGARLGGYCADMTRTFSIGRWPKALSGVYDVVLEAHLAGIAAVAPGVSCAEVDAAARGVIERAGFGDRFGHGLGHGIGLEVHERPRLSRRSDDVLEPGMVVTVEPGVYLPGVGGVRIEDDVVVTERGARNLCSLPKGKDWATL